MADFSPLFHEGFSARFFSPLFRTPPLVPRLSSQDAGGASLSEMAQEATSYRRRHTALLKSSYHALSLYLIPFTLWIQAPPEDTVR